MRVSTIRSQIILIAILLCACVVIWYALWWIQMHQVFRITAFSIGQGDTIFIESPSGVQILIDGGPDEAILAKLGRTMPFWDRTIDLIVLTHPHADHITGLLGILKRYRVGMVLEAGVNHALPEYDEWHRLLTEQSVRIVNAKRGQRFEFIGTRARLDVLTPFGSFGGTSPPNIHDAMVVSMLRFASSSMLLMGDAEKALERRLVYEEPMLRADVLKVGHHGSKTSTSEEFLQAVTPRYAIISAGRKNRYGHPHQEVIDRLKSFGVVVERTDIGGDIRFISDGAALVKE